jgi:ABC-2 type transport system ATP-binding protein
VVSSGRDTLTVSGLPSERVVALLGEGSVPFAEVSAHRATLEEAYMDLTRDSVDFRGQGLPPDTATSTTTAEGEQA